MPEVLSPESVKVPTKPQTADEINDLFNEIDKETPPGKRETKSKEKEESPEKEDIKDLDDDELELKSSKEEGEEEEDKLDLTESDSDKELESALPRKKEILAKYPDLFKTFPFLEKMMYRDKEITSLFGSFDDARAIAEKAKEVEEKAEVFNNFESQLLSGDTKDILREVKEADSKAFDKIVDNYLPALAEVDKDAYWQVVGNLNRRLIMEMVKEANDSGNDDLKNAALLVNQFIFGTSKFTAPSLRSSSEEKDTERSEVEQERLSLVKERFESARDDLQSRVDNTLKATISDYIDPKGIMTGYVKKNAIIDAMKILEASIASDSSVAKNLDTLWRTAFNSKFSKESLSKIQSFYLSKAKGNLKTAILKARAEALKDLPPRHNQNETDKTDGEGETTDTRRELRRTPAPGRPSQSKGKNEMKKGETVTDFFMRD